MTADMPSRIDELIATGRARPALRRLGDLPVPEPRSPGDPILSGELAKTRRTERY